MAKQPLVSIITVTFNAEQFLEKTIQSVISQTYPNIEYLLIDGQSTDGTLEIIKKYESQISYWLSEKDEGLYDAMNKGLQLAKGEYIWFMNAGDEIYQAHSLESVFTLSKDADIYYGETEYRDLDNNLIGLRSKVTPHHLPQKLTWQSMRYGMVVCHQSFIVKREIAPQYQDKIHPYSADIDWVIECLKNAKQIQSTEKILALYLQGGFSRKHLKKSLSDRFQILKRHFGLIPTILAHVWILLRGGLFVLRRKKLY